MCWVFRLTFHHSSSGFFQFPDESASYAMDCGVEIKLTARDADRLCDASRFHVDGRPFSSADEARAAGEKFRKRLQLLDVMLGLGITVPTADRKTGGVSEEVKQKYEQQYGGCIVDNVAGLSVYPDDGKHHEIVMSGYLSAAPREPDFVFTEIEKLWAIEYPLDKKSQDALNILAATTSESSGRTKFLLTYFGAEQLIERPERDEKTKSVIRSVQGLIADSDLDESEKNSLKSIIGGLNYLSFKDALIRVADRIKDPPDYYGLPLKDFLELCVKTRHKIAHQSKLDDKTDLNLLSANLRHFILSLVWSIHGLEQVSVHRPPDKVGFSEGDLVFRIRKF